MIDPFHQEWGPSCCRCRSGLPQRKLNRSALKIEDTIPAIGTLRTRVQACFQVCVFVIYLSRCVHAADWFTPGDASCSKTPGSPAELMRIWDKDGVKYKSEDIQGDGDPNDFLGVILTKDGDDTPLAFFKNEGLCNEVVNKVKAERARIETEERSKEAIRAKQLEKYE